MRHEYLLFDALVLLPPLLLSFSRHSRFVSLFPQAFLAIVTVAVPFLAWDAAVAGRHWWWNERYVSGVYVGRLPVEEILFFIAMPFACLFTWHALFPPREHEPREPLLRWVRACLVALLPLGSGMFVASLPGYTSAALTALGAAAALDIVLGTGLLLRPRFFGFLGVVALLTLVCNGYLTARPVVLYGSEHQLGVLLGTIPVEDFIYGFSLVIGNAVVFRWLGEQRAARGGWLARTIEARLGGYRQVVVMPGINDKKRVEAPARVLVAGSGIAGLSAATILAERGFSVTIREKNSYLGGKVGAWKESLAGGREVTVEHGFHAFFRQYYNLNRLLERVGVTRHFRAIDDYAIMDKQGAVLSFKDIATPPVLNLLSLAHHGIVPWRDLLTNPKLQKLEALLRYDREATFSTLDTVSFAEFAEAARLPPRLRLAFNTFARAFFADEQRMSMAELIKGFHFYYLSNDRGLLYDHLDDDSDRALLQPFVRHLHAHGARILTNTPVSKIDRLDNGEFDVDGERFDAVVLATDAAAARTILLGSPLVQRAAPELRAAAEKLKSSQRYSVLRVWLDRDVPRKFPVFLVTERERVLDAVTFNHWFQPEAEVWAMEHGGGVYEAHCYALPDDVRDEDVQRLLLKELFSRIPELAFAKVVDAHLQIRNDFTAYHVGLAASRPGPETEVDKLLLAGDWVRLAHPAMLMEAACMSGVLAANAVARAYGVREEIIEAVPARGIMAQVSRAA